VTVVVPGAPETAGEHPVPLGREPLVEHVDRSLLVGSDYLFAGPLA
jgi:hypothetical protein